MNQKLVSVFLSIVFIFMFSLTASAARPGFGQLFYEGEIVRTVVPPAAMPFVGKENLYVIQSDVEGQLPVAAVAPGDKDYHGGKWAFHSVMWNMDVDPESLASEAEVLAAASVGEVTITRIFENDFKCPIQPGGKNKN